MLAELVRIVRERDPDVIEGHNLFRFDLEYLEARARRIKIKLSLGRDGSADPRRVPRGCKSPSAPSPTAATTFTAAISIDTWMLAQHYDIASRELEGFGLKELTAHFGLERAGPSLLRRPARSATHFDHRARRALSGYSLDDVTRGRGAGEMLSPSYFVQAQIFPYSYQNAVSARERDQNRRAPDARLPRAAPFDPDARRADRSRGRLHRNAPMRRRPQRAALRRHLALSLADARRTARPAADRLGVFLRHAGRSAQLSRPGQGGGARAGGQSSGAISKRFSRPSKS